MTCSKSAYSLYEVEYVVSVASAGNVVVGLQYSSGSHGLLTLGVDLIGSDGAVSYKSYIEKVVGSLYQSSPYNYTLSSVAAGTYILRIIVCHESVSNNLTMTNGNITVTGANEVTEADDIYTAYNSIASSNTYVSDTYVGAYTTAAQTALVNAASAYNTGSGDLTALQDAHRTRQGNRTVLANGEIFQIKCTDATYTRGYIAYYADGNNEENVSLAGAIFSGKTYPVIGDEKVHSGWSVYYYDSKYYLYNAHNGKFVKVVDRIVKYTENLTEAATIVLSNTSGSVTEWNLKIYGTSTYLSASVSRGNADGAVRTDGNADDAGAKFNLIKTGSSVSDADAGPIAYKILKSDITSNLATVKPYHAKTDVSKVGYYTFNGNIDVANAITAAEALSASSTASAVETSLANLKAILAAGYTINQPTAGKLYRLKGKVNTKYVTGNLHNDIQKMALSAENGVETVFMFRDAGNGKFKLLNVGNGFYINNTWAIGSSKSEFDKFTFEASPTNIGYYVPKTDKSSCYMYNDNEQEVVDRQNSYAANVCDWEIEEVTWLPVPVYADPKDYKLGTFYSPVPLRKDESRIKFYTGTVTNNYLNLTEYTDNVIPANTAFVTEYVGGAVNGCAYLEIASDDPDSPGNNQLQGQLETITTPTITGKTIYTMQVFEVNNDSKLTFARYTGTTVKGFRAYLPVDNSTIEAGLGSFRLVFGVPTGIDTIGNQPAQEQTVYDLSGRRVEHAGKGLYIVNGKKVMIK